MMWVVIGCAALAGDPPPPAEPPTPTEQVEAINDNLSEALERLKAMAEEPPPPADVPPAKGTYAVVTVDEPPPPVEPPQQ